MDKDRFLYFEEDDTSEMSANGKQVFVAKRINGTTTRNKANDDKDKRTLNNKVKKEENNDYLILGLDKIKIVDEKPQNNSGKPPKSKKKNKKKKQKRNNKIVKFIIILLIIIATVIFAFVSPIFNISEINVNGTEKIDVQTIISLSDLKLGDNIFKNNKKDIKNKIMENAYIDNVTVKRVLPNSIELNIKERKAKYQVQIMEGYVYIDYQGYILEKSEQKLDLPLIVGLNTSNEELLTLKRIKDNDIENINSLSKIINYSKEIGIYDYIAKIDIENEEYILELDSVEKVAYLGDSTDIRNKLLYVKEFIEREEGEKGLIYVNGNINDGFKPYFRVEE